jgi:hypothetical protein
MPVPTYHLLLALVRKFSADLQNESSAPVLVKSPSWEYTPLEDVKTTSVGAVPRPWIVV